MLPPWVFKNGANIVDRGLKVLFFSLFFCYFSAFFTIFGFFSVFFFVSWKWLNSAIFGYFMLIFGLFFR